MGPPISSKTKRMSDEALIEQKTITRKKVQVSQIVTPKRRDCTLSLSELAENNRNNEKDENGNDGDCDDSVGGHP